jgi:hypothetical protein
MCGVLLVGAMPLARVPAPQAPIEADGSASACVVLLHPQPNPTWQVEYTPAAHAKPNYGRRGILLLVVCSFVRLFVAVCI